jgi:hydroxymethylbilane synthase
LSNSPHILRLGTRGSLLARKQSQLIADALMQKVPGLMVQLEIISTSGDRVTDRPLYDIGGKGLFTKEIEQALLDNRIDFAVHSFKDVPITMPLVDTSELVIAAVPPREDVHDVLIGAPSIRDLPSKARVGTSSLRRKCQLLAHRPDLQILPIRGNIDTRLRKLASKEFDAIILALAGLRRADLFDAATMNPIPVDQMLPAAGQGALALQCRKNDKTTQSALSVLMDPTTLECVDIERQIVLQLNGNCHSPIAALAQREEAGFYLRIAIGQRDGTLPIQFASARHEDSRNVVQEALKNLQL